MTIVIIGGTFNPPTLAHIALARQAKKAVDADMVIFVPTKSAYMKTWKKYQNSDIYSDEVRLQAIKSCETEWLKVDTCETDEIVTGHSYDTVQYIKSKYNTDDVYFAIGSDKLNELSRWSQSTKFLSNEKFVVMSRNDDDVEKIMEDNKKLRKYKDHFTICTSDEKYKDYSSTTVRALLSDGADASIEKAKSLIPESVWIVLQEQIMKNSNPKLKTCPFCCSVPHSGYLNQNPDGTWYVGCSNCDIGFSEETREAAETKWNTRYEYGDENQHTK